MVKLLIFIAFLIIYALYLWSGAKIYGKILVPKGSKLSGKIKHREKDNFFQNELAILVSNLFLFALLFTIGRFFNLTIVLIALAFTHVGLLLTYIAWSLLGSPRVPYKAVGAWAGYNFGIKNVWYPIFTLILTLLILIAYPIFIGIDFFGTSSLENIRVYTLQWTIILLLVTYVINLPYVIYVLSANYIDEDTRSRYLVVQFASLIPNSFWIALFFWTKKLGQPDQGYSVGDMSINFQPLIFTILISFFILFFLLPYFIGIQRAKQVRNEQFDSRNIILEKTIEAIDLATPKTINTEIQEIEQLLDDSYETLEQNDRALKEGEALENLDDDTSATIVAIADNFKEARPYDQRFAFLDFLTTIRQKMEDLKSTLSMEQTELGQKESIKNYANYFKEMKKELAENQDKKSKTNPLLLAAIVAILSPFITQFVTEASKFLVEYFKKI